MELRTRLNGKDSDDQAEGLFVKGCSDSSSNSIGRFSERDFDKGEEKSRSQSQYNLFGVTALCVLFRL
jgi:hypothetical protein